MSWTVPTPTPVDGPLRGPDRPMLEGFLGWQRSTLVNICAGLDAAQLASRPLSSTTMSLLGLIRHLTKVERIWLRQRAAAEQVRPLYPRPDSDFEDTDPALAEQELIRLREEWGLCDRAVAPLDWEHRVEVDGETFSLAAIYVHVLCEYARHNGHADLLREALDGVTAR